MTKFGSLPCSIRGFAARCLAGVALSTIVSTAAHGQTSAAVDQLDQQVAAAASRVQPQVVAWRRDIHQHPELSEEEVRTAALVAAHLRALGMEVRTGIGKTGVIGILRGARPGKTVALRAELDALPVLEETGLPFASKVTAMWGGKQTPVGHMCGHDANTAILMGAASVLAGLKAQLRGNVMFVFQPAEEGTLGAAVSGAERMINEKAFDALRPDAMFALHVMPGERGQLMWRSGALYAASDRIELKLSGAQTHGARPWDGTDLPSMAADIVHAFSRIAARQLDVTRSASVLTIAAINGGNRFNILPDQMTLLGTLRTFDPEVRLKARAKAEQAVAEIAKQYDATAEFIWTAPTPASVNDPKLVAKMGPVLTRAAKGNVDADIPALTGSDDFSYFAQAWPSLYYNIGVGPTKGTNHSPVFDIGNESILEDGVRAQAMVALNYLAQAGNE